MGSSHKPKSTRGKRARSGKRPRPRRIFSKASIRPPSEFLEIPPGFLDKIEDQREALMIVITLLHCLHAVLHEREGRVNEHLNSRMEIAAKWVSLPEMTAMLLERTHAVISALDSMNLIKAIKKLKP